MGKITVASVLLLLLPLFTYSTLAKAGETGLSLSYGRLFWDEEVGLRSAGWRDSSTGKRKLEIGLQVGYLFPVENGFMLTRDLGGGALRCGSAFRYGLSKRFQAGFGIDYYLKRRLPDYILPPTTYTLSFLPLSLALSYHHPSPGLKGDNFLRVGGGYGWGSLVMKEKGAKAERVRDWLPHLFLQVGVRGPVKPNLLLEFTLEYRVIKKLEGGLILDKTWTQKIKEDISGLSLLIGLGFNLWDKNKK